MASLTFDMDDKTHYDFKKFCLKKNVTMTEALNVAISMILRGQIKITDKIKQK